MSSLITNKLVTPCGGIGDSTTVNIVDAAGNIKGSAQFLNNFIVDYAGNLGSLSILDCTLLASIFGASFASGVWEVQKGTVETVGTDWGTNSNAYISPITSFASANTTGIMAGVVSGAGTWIIQGAEQTIGGVMYPGNGLIITTANNTITGLTTVQSAARLNLGLNETSLTGSLAGGLTIENSSVVNAYGANTSYFTKSVATTINAGALMNFIGNGVCGAGMLQVTDMVNNGDVVLDKVILRPFTSWAGAGRVLVKNGATFDTNSKNIGASNQAFTINGCGWCDSTGKKLGAIRFGTTASNFTSAIKVATTSCITAPAITTQTLSGVISGGGNLEFSCDVSPKPSGLFDITNNSNTYYGTITVNGTTLRNTATSTQYAKIVLTNSGRLTLGPTQSTIRSLESYDQTTYWDPGGSTNNYIAANGETTFSGRFWGNGVTPYNYYLNGGSSNIMHLNHNTTTGGHMGTLYVRNGAKLILEDGTKFTGTQGQIRLDSVSTLSSNTTTSSASNIYIQNGSILDVQKVGTGASKITSTGTFDSTGGFKVNVPAGLTAGTYPILQANVGGTLSVPTTNINLSGLTATYAWNAVNPRILTMTLT